MPTFKLTAFLPLLVISLLIPALGFAQTETEVSRLKPEQYFDFWVGTWDLTWKASDGTIQRGTNHIEKILGGKVVMENFEAKTGRLKGYEGKSVSVYEKRTGTWKQTWVDNSSEYIDLVGKVDGNKRIFWTETTGPNGEKTLKRMVFYDITENSFTWDWESSTDNGDSWQLRWRIHYKRSDEASM
ncbi:MAG: hypothetical protein PVH63_11820 [Balneolaceae bacterium]|jgi:hypothetical protein